MKYLSILMIIGGLLLASCSGNKTEKTTDSVAVDTQVEVKADILGQWYIENIVFNDDNYVQPCEEVPGVHQYIMFAEKSYDIQTNCNSFHGDYTLQGDSIHFGDGTITEMACDNMKVEQAISKLLPTITTVYVQNDSIVRLDCSESSAYIVLRKATENK